MALLTRFTRVATVAIGAASLCLTYTKAADDPDPWFTKEHKKHVEEDEKPKRSAIPGKEEEKEPTVTIRRTNPSTLVKRMRKELQSVPEANLGKRIALLEQIVYTDRPKEEDIAALEETTELRTNALNAIDTANQPSLSLEDSVKALAPYSQYYLGDSELLVELLKSDFSNRLNDQVSSLSRRNQTTQLALIKTQIDQAGLSKVFGSRIQTSAGEAASSMIAKRWAELLDETTPLPGEAYLVSQLLGHSISKLSLAVEIPANTDPRLSASIVRGLESEWGNEFQLTTLDQREADPEFVLNIDIQNIQSTNTVEERQVGSKIPGAVVEEPNPDFLELVKRYEKAAEAYQSALEHYEILYEDYIEALNNDEYRNAQEDLNQARENLAATPPPVGDNPQQAQAYASAVGQVQTAEAMARSVSQPIAIEPMPPQPHHLKILENIHLVPSTLIISAEETPYEYTEKSLDFVFEAKAPVQLSVPLAQEVNVQSEVSLNQNREWIANEGVSPRDPSVDSGTYSESEYQSALDMFGLEFATSCANELRSLLKSAGHELEAQTNTNSLQDSLLLLSLKTATNDTANLKVGEQELAQLSQLAMDPQTDAKSMRAACLSILLSKTQFAHLADQKRIEQLL
ncbi:hypothetical protein [Pelagicoccus mobilis]|uniref:Uncharacterized protein n=1 Tax=Pelagicoccus mobilis TaxID=415221 RepID=A0A934RV62_9BACT|nr:hypothetical protein [Pelagicoccus mobilis]MBK1875729.1 hypothetical protein [Pelagicoccus mobilis]